MLALEERVALLQGGISIVAESDAAMLGFLGLSMRSPAGEPSEQWVDVSLVTLAPGQAAGKTLRIMLEVVSAGLRAQGVTGLVCLAVDHWLQRTLAVAGFHEVDQVLSYLHTIRGALPNPKPAAMLRPAHPSDADSVLGLNARAFAPLWCYDASKMLGWLLTSDHATVAILDAEPIGFALTTRGSKRENAQLIRIATDPSVQRRGVGRQMVADALLYAREQDVAGLALNTQASNAVSRRIYKSMGFHIAGPPVSVMVYDL